MWNKHGNQPVAYTFSSRLDIVSILQRAIDQPVHTKLTVCLHDATSGVLLKTFDFAVNRSFNTSRVDLFHVDSSEDLVVIEKCFKFNLYLLKLQRDGAR